MVTSAATPAVPTSAAAPKAGPVVSAPRSSVTMSSVALSAAATATSGEEGESAKVTAADAVSTVASSGAGGEKNADVGRPKRNGGGGSGTRRGAFVSIHVYCRTGGVWPVSRRRMRPSLRRRQQYAGVCTKGRKICAASALGGAVVAETGSVPTCTPTPAAEAAVTVVPAVVPTGPTVAPREEEAVRVEEIITGVSL